MHPLLQHFLALASIAATYTFFYRLTNFLASKISNTAWLFNALLLYIFGSSSFKCFIKSDNLYFLLLSILSFIFVSFFVYKGLQIPPHPPRLNINLNKQEVDYILKILEREKIAIQATDKKPLIAKKYENISSALNQLIIKMKVLCNTSTPQKELSCNRLETSIIMATLDNALIASCADDDTPFDQNEEDLRMNLSLKLVVPACRAFKCQVDDLDIYRRD